MLQIKNIKKTYRSENLVQHALDDVSFNLREHEFVAVLGPSGSGKTTLLNIIGGLDQYDSGDLIINNISTKKYKDRDWDSYRNHSVGFVFQSYNLIPHQSVVGNVEIALTISGISKSERRKMALDALDQVGLKEHAYKRPNQLSGGQMQRVAIARALVNNPDIVLADEPTGALDSETGVQIMELLKEIAQDRLVVMVTHNADLADAYATRIIHLLDGKITEDSNPYEPDAKADAAISHQNLGKSSMSFGTSLMLSLSNLRTKIARTLLTAFAGSIGIIGIALILSLSTGVNTYIDDIQKDTMSSYPITINAEDMDMSRMMEGPPESSRNREDHKSDGVYASGYDLEMTSITAGIKHNNLTEFKKYLDDPNSPIHEYVGKNGIDYSYQVLFSVYTQDPKEVWFRTDGYNLDGTPFRKNLIPGGPQDFAMSGEAVKHFSQLMSGQDGQLISDLVKENYEVVSGQWPNAYNEIVLILNERNEIRSQTAYELGLLPIEDLKKHYEDIASGEEIDYFSEKIDYEKVLGKTYRLIPAGDFYTEEKDGTFKPLDQTDASIKEMLPDALELKVSGVVRLKDDQDFALMRGTMAYTKDLTDYLIEQADKSDIAKAQKADPDHNIVNGAAFEPADDEEKIQDVTRFIKSFSVSDKADLYKRLISEGNNPEAMEALKHMEEVQMAEALDQYLEEPDAEAMLSLYDSLIYPTTYDNNLKEFGVVSLDSPSSISIYADRFEDKDGIADCIKAYNDQTTEENHIVYSDYVALLMSSVTKIINVITYVLIAFVAVSLVVSSIMIGIITYISVLERTKEIGILRAVGASKRNIAQVFNAEAVIIGLFAGLIGVGISLLLQFPLNSVIHSIAETDMVNAQLPLKPALILIALSMVLTVIGSLIPSRKAAKMDPVAALRSE